MNKKKKGNIKALIFNKLSGFIFPLFYPKSTSEGNITLTEYQ